MQVANILIDDDSNTIHDSCSIYSLLSHKHTYTDIIVYVPNTLDIQWAADSLHHQRTGDEVLDEQWCGQQGFVTRSRRARHDSGVGRIEAKSGGGWSIGHQVHPEEVQRCQRFGKTYACIINDNDKTQIISNNEHSSLRTVNISHPLRV